MMKKRLFLSLLLITGVMLAACGLKTENKTQSTTVPAESQPAAIDDLDIQVGVGQRGEYEDENPTQATEATQPVETKPTEEQTGSELTVTYAQYQAMTEEEQEAFVESFPTMSDFVDWWNAAQAAQEKDDPIILDGNAVDLGDLIP